METLVAELLSAPTLALLGVGIKLTAAFFIVKYMKLAVLHLLQYVLVLAHDSAFGVVYLIESEHWTLDKITYNAVILKSLEDRRFIKRIPLAKWTSMERTIVMTNNTTCSIQERNDCKNSL